MNAAAAGRPSRSRRLRHKAWSLGASPTNIPNKQDFPSAPATDVIIHEICTRADRFQIRLTSYCAAARNGMCARRKRRTRSIVRCFSSSGSFHGNTVISALGASEATSIEVQSG